MSTGDDRTALRVLELLAERGQTVAVAESLTGGMVAARLTSVAGASRGFRGSVTSYATDVKRDVLGVDGALLDERGAVDPDVACRMASGVAALLGSEWGIATTGVAGPDRQDGKPVGTVYVAVAGPHRPRPAVRRLHAQGGREDIRQASTDAVLVLLTEELAAAGAADDTEQNGGNGCLQP
jgi:nicotinamide-nucleotide amidase